VDSVQRSGYSEKMALCHTCHCVSSLVAPQKGYSVRCPRCHSKIHQRKENTIHRTWAMVALGFITFIPSHIFPVMVITQLGSGTFEKTILGGVKNMAQEGLYGLAAIVFLASVVVPLFKLVGLTILLIVIQNKKLEKRFFLTKTYRAIVFIGRWSMVDIFFAAIFISLLQLGNFVNIQVGLGAPAFASMCIITMVASEMFDPRLLWDQQENSDND
jgi:paraquat-inducible protein A